MKIGEMWVSKKVYGPPIRVKIKKLQPTETDDIVDYMSMNMNTVSSCFRWQFLSLYEKDWNYENR